MHNLIFFILGWLAGLIAGYVLGWLFGRWIYREVIKPGFLWLYEGLRPSPVPTWRLEQVAREFEKRPERRRS